MPTWGEILREITQSTTDRGAEGPDFDGIRLKYIRQLRELSGRAIIVYASAWLQQGGAGNQDYLVEARDVHAMMEVCHGVEERELDLIIREFCPSNVEILLTYGFYWIISDKLH